MPYHRDFWPLPGSRQSKVLKGMILPAILCLACIICEGSSSVAGAAAQVHELRLIAAEMTLCKDLVKYGQEDKETYEQTSEHTGSGARGT